MNQYGCSVHQPLLLLPSPFSFLAQQKQKPQSGITQPRSAHQVLKFLEASSPKEASTACHRHRSTASMSPTSRSRLHRYWSISLHGVVDLHHVERCRSLQSPIANHRSTVIQLMIVGCQVPRSAACKDLGTSCDIPFSPEKDKEASKHVKPCHLRRKLDMSPCVTSLCQ